MSKSASISLVAIALALAGPALAQSVPLAAALDAVNGQEVVIDGHIGTGLDITDNEALAFRGKAGSTFPVIFDAGREARKKLAGCKFALFGGGMPCAMKGKAEIVIEGSTIRLSIFEMERIDAPAKLP